MIALFVALGAAVGAPARYLTDRAVQSRHDTAFPFGTLAVNLVASLVLGVVAGAAGRLSPQLQALIGVGFCGALSTFSTFSYETLRLQQTGRRRMVAANVASSVLLGVAAAATGWGIGSA